MNDTTVTKEMTCIICPVGCRLKVTFESGKVSSVEGNSCPRGAKYAKDESEHPVRTLTSTVKLCGGELPLVPVRTDKPIPKDRIFEAMAQIRACRASAPVRIGDVLIENVAGVEGVCVVATRNIGKQERNG